MHYLARLHNVLRLPEIQEFQMAAAQTDEADPAEEKNQKNLEYIAEPLDEEIERHTKAEKGAEFHADTKEKTAFESRFLELYPEFMAPGRRSNQTGMCQQFICSASASAYGSDRSAMGITVNITCFDRGRGGGDQFCEMLF